jgi:hypothetical protein
MIGLDVITRNGNFRIELTASGAGFDVFSNVESIELLARSSYGHGLNSGKIFAIKLNNNCYVFSAQLFHVKDIHGKTILVEGKSYGISWQNLSLKGIVRDKKSGILYASGVINDSTEYEKVANLAIELFSDFKVISNYPSVRQIVFAEDERFEPKIIGVVPQ